jgi:glycogen synthase
LNPTQRLRPRRVLMTADTMGGVWTYGLELCRAFATSDIRVLLATMGAPLNLAQQADVAELSKVEVAESTFKLEWMPGSWNDVDAAGQWLLDLEQRFRPDVIHLNGFAHGALPFRAPRLVVAHSCVRSWWRAVKGTGPPREWDEYARRVRLGLQSAALVVAPTAAMLDALQHEYGLLPHSLVIHNGRDPLLFQPGRKEPLIASAGRLWDEAKNIVALADAAPSLPWPVVVAGNLRDPAGNGVSPARVHLTGLLSPRQIASLYARAAIFAAPVRYEPFGLAILEAALAGCALVLGDIRSLRELWDGAALFVPPSDPLALRIGLSQLIEDPERRAELAGKARRRALRLHPGVMGRSYRAAYRSLLEKRPTQHRPTSDEARNGEARAGGDALVFGELSSRSHE